MVRQIRSSTNYIYAGVCFSMVLAVIVLATLLFQAQHGAVLPFTHLYAVVLWGSCVRVTW